MVFFSYRNIAPNTFSRCYEKLQLPQKDKESRVCKLLGIQKSTLRAWLSGQREPQQGATIALWFEAEGYEHIDTHKTNELRLIHGLAQSRLQTIAAMENRIAALTAEIHALKQASTARAFAANDSYALPPTSTPAIPQASARIRRAPAFTR